MGLNNLTTGGTGGLRPPGLKNLSEIYVIPASAVLHYPFVERSDNTVIEKLEGENGTANGTTNVSGDWRDGYAEDGTDDYIELTNWSNVQFMDNLFNHSLIWTIETTSTATSRYWGAREGNLFYYHGIGAFTTGRPVFAVRDDTENRLFVEGDIDVNDGNPHRIAWELTGNSLGDLRCFVDGSEVSLTADADDILDGTQIFDMQYPFSTHSWNNDGTVDSYFNGVLDNGIAAIPALSAQEYQDDYDNQPWS